MISIENLSKDYGDFRALDNLCLHVPKGELFCFLGPNGAGKTTTIKILVGLLRATSGSASINGCNVKTDSLASKKIVGYIPDMPYLYERLTTSEFFEFTGEIYNVSRDKIEYERQEAFKLFGLLDYRNKLVKELSHGLKQRLIYASTLLHKPEVLFIDEPLIGLDPYTIRLIKDLLKEHTKAGMTIFLTTHILALAEDIADRIGIINHGKLAALGTLADLKTEVSRHNLEEVFLKITDQEQKEY